MCQEKIFFHKKLNFFESACVSNLLNLIHKVSLEFYICISFNARMSVLALKKVIRSNVKHFETKSSS